MANTTLPTALNTGNAGHIGFHNTVHKEINELSRQTTRRNASSLLINGWTIRPQSESSRGVHIERVRDKIYVYISGLDGTNATSPQFMKFVELEADGGISTNFMSYGGFYRSGLESDTAGGTWLLQSDIQGLHIISEGQNYKRYLGGYWRTFVMTTRSLNMPSFLPPAAP